MTDVQKLKIAMAQRNRLGAETDFLKMQTVVRQLMQEEDKAFTEVEAETGKKIDRNILEEILDEGNLQPPSEA